MAILKKNDNGFRGKIGKTVVYELNGQVIQREIGEYTDNPTAKQLEARQITGMIATMLKRVNDFVEIGFKLEARGTRLNSNNIASSINRGRVIKGTYPNLEIDYRLAVFSRGILPVNALVKVTSTSYGLEFSWDPAMIIRGMKATDQIMIIVYCPEKGAAFMQLDGARRKDGSELISLPRYRESITLHTYISFISSDRKKISDSLFTGSFLW